MKPTLILGILAALLCLPARQAQAQLVDNGDQTVTDRRTGLTWQKTGGPGVLNWAAAMDWADTLVFAGSGTWRLPTQDELKALYTTGLGGTEGGPTPSFVPFVIGVPSSGSRWMWSSDGLSPVQKTAVNFDDGRSQAFVAGSTLVAWAVRPADSDGDGIWDAVDLQPLVYSNAFRAGTGTGTLVDRGDQMITVRPNELGGVTVEAAASGGARPASYSACNGIATGQLSPGSVATFSCGSVTTKVLSGSVPMMFYADGWTVVRTTLAAGLGLTFRPETRTFTTDATNVGPVTLTAEDGTGYSLQPGETRTIERSTPPPQYAWWVAAFLAGLALGLLICRLRRRGPP